jgi:hypothetical protein
MIPWTHAQMTARAAQVRPEDMHPISLSSVRNHHLTCHGLRSMEHTTTDGAALFARGWALVNEYAKQCPRVFAPDASHGLRGVCHSHLGVRVVYSNDHDDGSRCWIADIMPCYVPWQGTRATRAFASRVFAKMFETAFP